MTGVRWTTLHVPGIWLYNLQLRVHRYIVNIKLWSCARPGHVNRDVIRARTQSKMSHPFALRQKMGAGTNFLSLIEQSKYVISKNLMYNFSL